MLNPSIGNLRQDNPIVLEDAPVYKPSSRKSRATQWDSVSRKEGMEGIEKDTRRKYFLCSWIARINIVKMALLAKVIYKFNLISKDYNDIVHRK